MVHPTNGGGAVKGSWEIAVTWNDCVSTDRFTLESDFLTMPMTVATVIDSTAKAAAL